MTTDRREPSASPARTPAAALKRLQMIYAQWLAGESPSEEVLFEIGDVLKTLSEAGAKKAPEAG